MLTQDRARQIFERIRKLSSAEEVELIVSGGRSALTRFANNAITQNVAEENYAGFAARGFRRTHGAGEHQPL